MINEKKGAKCDERAPHPTNTHQFIICFENGDYTIMDCPNNLVFNKFLDRCDYNLNEQSKCANSPCSHGGKCIDLPNSEYKCECSAGYSGERCEKTPDVCVHKPCGPHGKCHSLPPTSPLPYYCTCFSDHMFGLGCNRNSEVNPCNNADTEESFFSTKLDPSMYIHCDGKHLNVQFCSRPLVFSTITNTCDWETKEASTGTTYHPLIHFYTMPATTALYNHQQQPIYSDTNSKPRQMYQDQHYSIDRKF